MQPRTNSILIQTGLVIFGSIILTLLIFSIFNRTNDNFLLRDVIDSNNDSGILKAQISVPIQYSEPLTINAFNNLLSIAPVNAQSHAMPESMGENIIKYSEAYPETDIVQTRKTSGLKEDIILKAPGHPEEFVYQINIQEFDIEKDKEGNFVFYTRGHKGENLYRIFTILAPFMIDVTNKESSTNDVKTSLTVNGILTITPDKEWLAKAVYPVILDPTIEINILNVHSYPQQGQNWEVSFTTQGLADLKIIPQDQATILDDEFLSLWCGQEQRIPQILEGDVIYYPNWQCQDVGKVVHYTKTAGNHTLKFEFSESIAFAYNQTYETITIKTDTTGVDTGSAFTVTISTSTAVNDDYVVVITGTEDDVPLITSPGGDWVTGDQLAFDSTYDTQAAIFYKKITDITTESGSYDFTAGANDNTAWWVGILNGVDGTTPEDESMSNNATTSVGTAPAAPSITTVTPGAFVLAAWSVYNDTAVTMPGGSWTTEVNNLDTGNLDLQAASRLFTSATSTGNVAVTNVTSGTATVCGQWAFRPAHAYTQENEPIHFRANVHLRQNVHLK